MKNSLSITVILWIHLSSVIYNFTSTYYLIFTSFSIMDSLNVTSFYHYIFSHFTSSYHYIFSDFTSFYRYIFWGTLFFSSSIGLNWSALIESKTINTLWQKMCGCFPTKDMQTPHPPSFKIGHHDINDAQCAETKILSRFRVMGIQKGRYGRPIIQFSPKVAKFAGKIGIDLTIIFFINEFFVLLDS